MNTVVKQIGVWRGRIRFGLRCAAQDAERENHAAIAEGNCGRWRCERRYYDAGRFQRDCEIERAGRGMKRFINRGDAGDAEKFKI